MSEHRPKGFYNVIIIIASILTALLLQYFFFGISITNLLNSTMMFMMAYGIIVELLTNSSKERLHQNKEDLESDDVFNTCFEESELNEKQKYYTVKINQLQKASLYLGLPISIVFAFLFLSFTKYIDNLSIASVIILPSLLIMFTIRFFIERFIKKREKLFSSS